MREGVCFDPDRLQRLARMESWHFWFVGRHILLRRLLDRYLTSDSCTILDLGCGNGHTILELIGRGFRVIGLDRHAQGLLSLRRAMVPAPLLQSDAGRLPFSAGSLDAVVLLDVLEHVEEGTVLAEIHRVLKSGGRLLLSVPAMNWLWSHRDRAAGHRRRYTRSTLVSVLKSEEFLVRDVRYYQCLIFPLFLLSRGLGGNSALLSEREERPWPWLNWCLSRLNGLEAHLSDHIPWPWGSSLLAVAEKP